MSAQVLDLLTRFSLEKLGKEWVTFIIESDFTEIEDIPAEFEEEHAATNFSGLFDAVNRALRDWVDSLPLPKAAEENRKSVSISNVSIISEVDSEERDTSSKFWVDLAQVTPVQNIMAFLYYYAYIGQKYDAKEQERELGCLAGSLYFLLLSVPGSNAFRIFHPVLFLKALDLMRLSTKLHVAAASPRKGKGPKVQVRRHADDMPLQGVEDDDDDTDVTLLTPREANNLVRNLNVLLGDFLRLTVRFSLKHSPESLDETIGILVDVTRSETQNAFAVFIGKPRETSVTSLVYNSYVALQCVCAALHGTVRKIVTLVLKHILPNILMSSRGTAHLSLRSLGVIRDHAVIFVRYLLTQIKEPAYEGVCILVQHLCLRVTDKADFRQKTSQSVVEILKHLPIKLYTKLIQWFFKFSHNEKAGHRLFTLEIISKLLVAEERQVDDEHGAAAISTTIHEVPANGNESSFNILPVDHSVSVPANRNLLSHKFLLSIIFSRCRDSAATVRSKALALLADCTLSDNPTIMLAMKQIFQKDKPEVFTTPHIDNNEVNIESPLEQLQTGSDEEEVEATLNMPNAVFCDHCRDPALLIRKQMVVSLTQLLELRPQLAVESWVMGVLPAILDPEIKVQEKVVEMLHQVLLGRLMMSGRRDSEETNSLPWLLLSTVTRLSYHKFLNKAISVWGTGPMAKPGIIAVAKSHIGGDHNEQAWLLLSLLSHCLNVTDATFAVQYYRDNCQRDKEVGWCCLQQVMRVLCNSIKSIDAVECVELQELLLQPVLEVAVGATLMPSIMDLLALINTKLHGEEADGQTAMKAWVGPMLVACDEHLQRILFNPQQHNPLPAHEEELLFRRIFLMGEAGLLLPSGVNKRMFLMLQSIIFQGQHGSSAPQSPPSAIPSSQTQSSQPLNVNFVPSDRVKAVSVAVLGKLCLQHENQAKRIIPALGQLLDTPVGPDIKTNIVFTLSDMCAVSVAVLGKLCLQHENQAKRIIPALGQLLDTPVGPDIKTNIVFTLSDMCVRYATVVDPLMPQVTACLRDPDLSVRRTTLTLVISLLQEDYLKLKGSFFYRILQCLCDDHEEIRNTAIFFLTERLLQRFPKIFSQHFIECIFHYNCYEEHESYNKFSQNQQEKELFSLAGPEHMAARMSIYKFMLEHMPDDLRFFITQRLCHDVLGGVVDGRMGATGSDAVLRDALLVLCSDEIKLASLKSRPEEDHATNQEEQAQIAGMAIKKTIISQVVKRNVIENIVPILIALKHKLEKQRSPLMKQLLLYFKEIMKDYKNEIKEILAGDKQLAEEIEFDLRKLEERQREEEAAERLALQAKLREEKRHQGKASEDPNRSSLPYLGTNAAAPSPGRRSSSSDTNEEEHVDERRSDNQDAPSDDKEPEADVSDTIPERIAKVALERLSPEKLSSIKENLLKTAVKNSQRLVRKAALVESSEQDDGESPHEGESSRRIKAALEKRRKSFAAETAVTVDGEEPSTSGERPPQVDAENNVETEEMVEETLTGENSQAELRSGASDIEIGNTEEKDENSTSGERNENIDKRMSVSAMEAADNNAKITELLRAISTPTRNQSVIRNITFMNKTHEVSAISVNRSTITEATEEENTEQRESILLHFKDPETYAKDDEFSRLRRNTKRSLGNDFKEVEKDSGINKKRSSGGLFESVSEGPEADEMRSAAECHEEERTGEGRVSTKQAYGKRLEHKQDASKRKSKKLR
ncbi:Condensin complex subunit 1 C-terminal [Trinorchestia longiramus]|nr:Condensin complex subunit 1 C-terminal [Trinorchestia longiramus]